MGKRKENRNLELVRLIKDLKFSMIYLYDFSYLLNHIKMNEQKQLHS